MARTPFSGRWRITWMSNWDQDYVDMEAPGQITFTSGRSGDFRFGLLEAQMDCRVRAGANPPRIEFTWQGFDEGDELTGRGHAELLNGELRGHLYIHLGDDSEFCAAPRSPAARKRSGN